MSRFDKVLVICVALALALMLPAPQWPGLVSSAGVQEDGRGAPAQSLEQHHGQEDVPPTPYEEPEFQLAQLFEDDVVMHDEYVFALVGLSLKLARAEQCAPDSPHTSEFERPPLHTA